jgi:hypothetical protein
MTNTNNTGMDLEEIKKLNEEDIGGVSGGKGNKWRERKETQPSSPAVTNEGSDTSYGKEKELKQPL